MSMSLLFTIEVSARPTNSGDGNNEHYTVQAIARNGERLLYDGESATLSDALEQLVNKVKKQENGAQGSAVHHMPKGNSRPLFARFCRAMGTWLTGRKGSRFNPGRQA